MTKKLILKYMPSLRFLDGGYLRFSQPTALNDPDEALPQILYERYASEDYEVAQVATRGRNPVDRRILEMQMSPFPAHRTDEKSFPGLWPATEKRLREEPFETLEEFDLAIVERAVTLSKALADRQVGILSLTESSDEPMWAYYAGNHSGVALRFDGDHPFFAARVRSIEYVDRPVSISTNGGLVRFGGHQLNREDILNGTISSFPEAILFRKRQSWQHEKELRVVELLRHADSVAGDDPPGYPIYLFQVPPAAVDSIVIGYRAAPDVVERTVALLEGDPKWSHVEVWRRRSTSRGMIEQRVRP